MYFRVSSPSECDAGRIRLWRNLPPPPMENGSPFATPGNLAKLAVFSFAQLRTLRSCIIQLLPYIVGACTIVVARWGLASCMTPTWTLVWMVLVVEAARHVFFAGWLTRPDPTSTDCPPTKSHRRRSRSSANHCFRHRCHLLSSNLSNLYRLACTDNLPGT